VDAELGLRQKTIDAAFPRTRRRVADELFDLVVRRRQSGELKAQPSNQRPAVGRSGGDDAGSLNPTIDPLIDRGRAVRGAIVDARRLPAPPLRTLPSGFIKPIALRPCRL